MVCDVTSAGLWVQFGSHDHQTDLCVINMAHSTLPTIPLVFSDHVHRDQSSRPLNGNTSHHDNHHRHHDGTNNKHDGGSASSNHVSHKQNHKSLTQAGIKRSALPPSNDDSNSSGSVANDKTGGDNKHNDDSKSRPKTVKMVNSRFRSTGNWWSSGVDDIVESYFVTCDSPLTYGVFELRRYPLRRHPD